MPLQSRHGHFHIIRNIAKPPRNIQIRVTQYLDAVCRKPSTAGRIAFARIRFKVLAAVQLNAKPDRWRVKIEDAMSHDVLTQEPDTTDLSQPQPLPHFALGRCLVAAQCGCA
jgi:hypothetical protein